MENNVTPGLLLHFKPSCYYFRRGLRAARTTGGIVEIVATIRREIEECDDFARLHGIVDRDDTNHRVFEVPNELDDLRAMGLQLCCDLENLKQAIRDQGLIPPKRHIMTSEAKDKGWKSGA